MCVCVCVSGGRSGAGRAVGTAIPFCCLSALRPCSAPNQNFECTQCQSPRNKKENSITSILWPPRGQGGGELPFPPSLPLPPCRSPLQNLNTPEPVTNQLPAALCIAHHTALHGIVCAPRCRWGSGPGIAALCPHPDALLPLWHRGILLWSEQRRAAAAAEKQGAGSARTALAAWPDPLGPGFAVARAGGSAGAGLDSAAPLPSGFGSGGDTLFSLGSDGLLGWGSAAGTAGTAGLAGPGSVALEGGALGPGGGGGGEQHDVTAAAAVERAQREAQQAQREWAAAIEAAPDCAFGPRLLAGG